jgi:hypothetical protein
MAAITSFTTYTGKQSEFRELVMKKLAGFARVDQLGFQLVEDVQSNKIVDIMDRLMARTFYQSIGKGMQHDLDAYKEQIKNSANYDQLVAFWWDLYLLQLKMQLIHHLFQRF